MTTTHENLGKADPISSAVPSSKRLSILNISSTTLGMTSVATKAGSAHHSDLDVPKSSQSKGAATSSGEKTAKKVT